MTQVTNDDAVSKSTNASGSVKGEPLISTGLSVQTADFAELADRMAAASEAHVAKTVDAAGRASRDLAGLFDALAVVREKCCLPDLLESAGRELCGAAIFGRVMVSRVSGSTWSPLALYVLGGDGSVVMDVDDTGTGVDDLEIPLASPLVEAEVVRRRLPALVLDASDEPRVYRPLLERTGATEYVVAPVVVADGVIALLHADAGTRALAELDRDLLRIFADGVALAYDLADLGERARHQRRAVAAACESALDSLEGSVTATHPALTLNAASASGDRVAGVNPSRDSDTIRPRREGSRLTVLTAREHEVLALMASGATNAQLADRLTVAESTVKSHVKHILHKLGASNRAAAIAFYLREARDDGRRTR